LRERRSAREFDPSKERTALDSRRAGDNATKPRFKAFVPTVAIQNCSAFIEPLHPNVSWFHAEDLIKRPIPVLTADSRAGAQHGIDLTRLRIVTIWPSKASPQPMVVTYETLAMPNYCSGFDVPQKRFKIVGVITKPLQDASKPFDRGPILLNKPLGGCGAGCGVGGSSAGQNRSGSPIGRNLRSKYWST
jgi:hypothetical protein